MSGQHAAPDRDRIGTLLTAGWAAGHLVVLALLGLATHNQTEHTGADRPALTLPDSGADPAA